MLTLHCLLIWLLLLAKVDAARVLSQRDDVDTSHRIRLEGAEFKLSLGHDLGRSNVGIEVEVLSHSEDTRLRSPARVASIPLGSTNAAKQNSMATGCFN